MGTVCHAEELVPHKKMLFELLQGVHNQVLLASCHRGHVGPMQLQSMAEKGISLRLFFRFANNKGLPGLLQLSIWTKPDNYLNTK